MPASGRVLGLDYGQRRIGVAISDPLGLTAQPLLVLGNKRKVIMQELAALIKERQVQTVVLGLPRHLSGQEGEKAAQVRAFGSTLAQATAVEVQYLDERLTTTAAQRVLTESGMSGRKKRRVVDKLAAVLILQNWLDRRRLRG
ncbi:Holliday junction resolvase RuvX [candidate division FCPU426 bacterium]|nr:Holliday junction resolvase RuvX [candidate division FCPU426 bacterium]